MVDQLRQLQHSVFDVQFGGKANHSHIGQDGAIVYANERVEMWGAMRAWLPGGIIPDDRELLADLTGVEYGYVLREGRDEVILEKTARLRIISTRQLAISKTPSRSGSAAAAVPVCQVN